MKVFNARSVRRGEAFIHLGFPYIRLNDDSGRVYDLTQGTVCRLKNFPDDEAVQLADVAFTFTVAK